MAVAVGYLNGLVVVKTKLPSFIVTLGSLFVLRGLTLGLTRLITGRTQVSGLHELAANDWLAPFFSASIARGPVSWLAGIGVIGRRADGQPSIQGIPISILWWIVLTVVAAFVLSRTKFGNWIYACGRRCECRPQPRRSGRPNQDHPVHRDGLRGHAVCRDPGLTAGSADTLRGTQKEFEAIIAAVIGGTLLTGGYGSAVGALFGALIFGLVQMGIFYTGVDTDWFKLFMGLMMVIAVLFNSYVLRRATESR